MPVIDMTQPFTALLCLACIVCAIFLGHEIKRAVIPAVALVLSIGLLITHTLQLFVFEDAYQIYSTVLSISLIYDFAFVLVTYLAYLWVDDIRRV